MNTLKELLEMPAIEGFDAVEESRRCKRAAGERLASMTPEQQDAYLQRAVEDFGERQAARRERLVFA